VSVQGRSGVRLRLARWRAWGSRSRWAPILTTLVVKTLIVTSFVVWPSIARGQENPLRSASTGNPLRVGPTAVVRRDVIVVCAQAWRASLQPWLIQRNALGWRVHWLEPQRTSDAMRAAIAQRAAELPSCQHLLLVGDAPGLQRTARDTEIPTHSVPIPISAKFGGVETAASDYPYGDTDGDGKADMAVGRWTMRSPEGLDRLVARQLQYEQDNDFGRWRRHVELVAGVGGFGWLADRAIENAAQTLLSDSLPGGIQLGVTHISPASPYFPGTENIRATVQQRYQHGSMAWLYLGHGWVDALDQIDRSHRAPPIMDNGDALALVAPQAGRPIAVLLACYTGALDIEEGCFAESMLAADGGPVAVFAGSRVTMPYGNAAWGAAMLDSWFEDHPPTMGDVLRLAQQRMVQPDEAHAARRPWMDLLAKLVSPTADKLAQERQEHVHLYNLFGDPTMPLVHPQPLNLDPIHGAKAGQAVRIRCDCSIDGACTVEIRRLRGQVATPDPTLAPLERFHQANDATIMTHRFDAKAGQIDVAMALPEGLQGGFVAVVEVVGVGQHALGSTTLLIP
jgi:hypothetical protein